MSVAEWGFHMPPLAEESAAHIQRLDGKLEAHNHNSDVVCGCSNQAQEQLTEQLRRHLPIAWLDQKRPMIGAELVIKICA